MPESIAIASQTEESTKTKNVEKTEHCTWTVKLYEVGGELYADWDSSTDFEPDLAHIVLYVKGKEVAREKTGRRKGTYKFANRHPGAGYSLALVATGFQGGEAAVVKTAESTGPNDFPLDGKARHQYRLALARSRNQAQLTWGEPGSRNDPSFKPREGKLILEVEGEDPKEYPIDNWHGSIPTRVRWGAGLTARYTAESFGHNPPRLDIVRIRTT